MRIKLITTPNTIPVPFNYQEKLVGTLHKWIGENEIHDKISLYSYSWLQGGCLKNNALDFTHGSEMFISFHHEKWIKQIIRSILNSPEMFCGMCVTDIVLVNSPDDLKNRELFFVPVQFLSSVNLQMVLYASIILMMQMLVNF